MSRLDELIAELCPDGVEYKPIGEIATDIYRGSGITRDQVTEEGTPCVRYGEIYTTYGVWFDECVSHTDVDKISSAKYFEHGDVLFAITGESVEDIAKSCAYVGHERCLAGGDIVVLKHNEDPKYLAYALTTTSARNQKSKGKVKSKVVHSSVPAIREIKVPVPPLDIQREIVRVLDNFTFLSAELSAELSARRKQYEYYRDQLLTFDNDTKRMPLSDVADLFRGEYITQKGSKPGNIPVILGGQEPAYYIDKANHEGEIVVIARSGVSAGFVSYWNQPIYVTDGFGYEARKGVVAPKYLYYALKRKELDLNAMKRGAGVPHVSGEMLGKVELSIPSLSIQERLVNVLDNFEAICSDLNIGLPAEIEARQEQYEYYRDLLLTFVETGSTLVTDGRQGRLK